MSLDIFLEETSCGLTNKTCILGGRLWVDWLYLENDDEVYSHPDRLVDDFDMKCFTLNTFAIKLTNQQFSYPP